MLSTVCPHERLHHRSGVRKETAPSLVFRAWSTITDQSPAASRWPQRGHSWTFHPVSLVIPDPHRFRLRREGTAASGDAIEHRPIARIIGGGRARPRQDNPANLGAHALVRDAPVRSTLPGHSQDAGTRWPRPAGPWHLWAADGDGEPRDGEQFLSFALAHAERCYVMEREMFTMSGKPTDLDAEALHEAQSL